MTRRDAIETVKQVMTELNRTPRDHGAELPFEQTIVGILIALEVLKVDDE